MFSRSCEYALKIMIYLGSIHNQEKRAGITEISAAINSPQAFSAKILQQLSRAGLLQSFRGPSGGFQIKRGHSITLIEIVKAIDGEGIVNDCVVGLEHCSEKHPCPVHNHLAPIRDQLVKVLTKTSIDEIKDGVMLGKYFLKL